MTFRVRLTRDAGADLDRLSDFLLERELSHDGGDLSLPKQAIAALAHDGIPVLRQAVDLCQLSFERPA